MYTGLYGDIHGMVQNNMYDDVRDAEFLMGANPGYDQPFWWDGGDPLWITATRQVCICNLLDYKRQIAFKVNPEQRRHVVPYVVNSRSLPQ